MDWAVANFGNTASPATTTRLFVDGVIKNSWPTSSLASNFFTSVTDYSLGTLAPGTHSVVLLADVFNGVAETNELNNRYEKTITVQSPAQPDLLPYQPGGWSDRIVVSNTTGTTTDASSLRSDQTLYLDWSVANIGPGGSPATTTRLFIDNVLKNSWATDSLASNSYTSITDYSLGTLSAGTHSIVLVADIFNVAAEPNEDNNRYEKTITVQAPPQPDLLPYQPSGWSDRIVVSTTTGTTTDSSPLYSNQPLYLDWAVVNAGAGASPATTTRLFVDNVLNTSWSTGTLAPNNYTSIADYSLGTLSPGTHSIVVVADIVNVAAEPNEDNNRYEKTITVLSPPQPDLLPYQPAGWTDRIVISTMTTTTSDSSPLFSDQTLYLDWAVINAGGGASPATTTRLFIDNVLRNSWPTGSLPAGNYASVTDYSLGTLAAGTHNIVVVADIFNVVAEPNEDNNRFEKTITVSQRGPVNDSFADRTIINGATVTVTGTNLSATKESGEPNHAGNAGGKSLWWTWTAPSSGSVQIDTIGSNFDTTLGVYTGGSVGALTAVPGGSNDDGGGSLTSKVTFGAVGGTTYQIAVDGYSAAAGNITLHVNLASSGPANNSFANRSSISGAVATASGTNLGASKETGEPHHAGNGGGKSVWWTWSAPSSGSVTIDTIGSNFDTTLGVYTGSSVSALTPVRSDDDSGGSLTSKVTFNAIAGRVYQIAVDGYNGLSGNIILHINLASSGPANDDFSNRITIGGSSATVTGTNTNATKETAEPNHAANAGGRSVWWKWAATSSGRVTIDTIGSTFDTTLGIYTGSSVSALTLVPGGSNDDGGGNRTSKVTFNAASGTIYQIAVDGYGGVSGNITLNVRLEDPVNDDPDDQVGEAIVLASLAIGDVGPRDILTPSNSFDRAIGSLTDVDLYSFSIGAGQRWAFDIDRTPGSQLDSYIRLFDANGVRLLGGANDNGEAPGESSSADSYLAYTFTLAGTYFVGISASGNGNYSVVTGLGGTGGSTGRYELYAGPFSYSVGQVQRPSISPTNSSPATINVSLRRVDGSSSEGISLNRTTWIVIHGRTDSQDSFVGSDLLGTVLGDFRSDDQVLTLDWRRAARDNSPESVGLDGAGWIPNVAAWAVAAIRALGLANSSVNLIGHSWGSYVAYDIAKGLGTARSIVALDPAFTGTGGYPDSQVNFRNVSDISWAFYGNGLYGSASLAATADEAFAIWPYSGLPTLGTEQGDRWLAKHRAPVNLFTQLVQENLPGRTPTGSAYWFNPNRLARSIAGSWRYDLYDSLGMQPLIGTHPFEGVFEASLSGAGESPWNDPNNWSFSNFRHQVIV